jgi:hypothetical protein
VWESVSAACCEHQRVEPGITGQSLLKVIAESVVAAQLVEQLEEDARPEPPDALDVALPSQATGYG